MRQIPSNGVYSDVSASAANNRDGFSVPKIKHGIRGVCICHSIDLVAAGRSKCTRTRLLLVSIVRGFTGLRVCVNNTRHRGVFPMERLEPDNISPFCYSITIFTGNSWAAARHGRLILQFSPIFDKYRAVLFVEGGSMLLFDEQTSCVE